MTGWNLIFKDDHSRLERIDVPGGWLYRNTGLTYQAVSIAFVPEGPPFIHIPLEVHE
jgi:hypothetical protein